MTLMRAILAYILMTLPAAAAQTVDQYAVFEASFETSDSYANSYTELSAEAVVVRPDGSAWRVPLFWDGGNAWKLRLSPDAPGVWRFTVSSPDAGLSDRASSFVCRPSSRRGSIRPMLGFPRHFQYQNGEPFWFMADTAWGYLTNSPEDRHDRTQAFHYADVRAGQGFNAIHVMMMSEQGTGNDGGDPFTDIGSEKINPAYWREVDQRLAHANSRGLTVGLALAWGDKRKVEPFAWRKIPGREARNRYARYIGARYGAYNVYFLVSGEWHAEIRTRENVAEKEIFDEFVALGDTLDAADPHGRMIGIHPMTRAGSVREFAEAPWMSFGDYQQNYRQLHERARMSSFIGRPVVNSEYGYYLRDADGDSLPDKSNSYSVDDMRHASWDIVMAGGYLVTGFGTTYFAGHRDPGPFDVDAAKNDDWEAQIQHIKKFFESIAYWKLIPADELLTCPVPLSEDRVEKVTRNGREVAEEHPPETVYWAMTIPSEAYVIYGRGLAEAVKLELDSRGGEFRIRHFNPRTGEWKDGGTTRLRRSGQPFEYRPPDRGDWVVLLERE